METIKFEKRGKLSYPKLMIPGPVEVSQFVLDAVSSQAVPDYNKDWLELYRETTGALQKIFKTKNDIFLLISSGTGGVECAINSLFSREEKVIVVENGFFGERMAAIARNCGIDVVSASGEWGKPIDPDNVRKLLETERSIKGLISVHHETSTGVLNPIKDLSQIARRYQVPFIVDAVSSLGGEEFDMDGWGIDICVTTSNKCLHALPGLAPIAVSNNAWDIINRKNIPSHGWYLNLKVWKQYSEEWSDWHTYPVTMAINSVLALNAALEELFAEGLNARIARYHDVAHYCRQQLLEQGFNLFVDGNHASSTISAVHRPKKFETQHIISSLQEKHNIRIAGGLGKTSGLIFRIGHMGKAASREYVDILINALAEILS